MDTARQQIAIGMLNDVQFGHLLKILWHAGSGEHGIAAVAVAPFEIIANHPMLGLHVPHDGLHRSAPTHLAADRGRDAATRRTGGPDRLSRYPDAELLGVVVAAIAFVAVNATGLDPGQRFQFRDNRPQSVTIEGVAVQCLGVQYKLTAFGAGVATDALQPNAYGARALPLPMHSTSGACSA
jgi:hypothetical protein